MLQAADLKVPDNMRLVSLPPYSPELNSTDYIWEEIREKRFQDFPFRKLDCVDDVLEDALQTLEHDQAGVASIARVGWLLSVGLYTL